MIGWEIKGRHYVNCNCAYGCPCQFNALPTYGGCHAVGAFLVTEGHFGDTDLAGIKAVALLHWPGAIHEGNGSVEAIVDEGASDAQREAMLKIMTGQETEPMATMFSVFASTVTTVHEPRFLPIDFEVDVENRTARLDVPGIVESVGQPIRNPVTGDIHRAQISLPHGFEYETAEIGAGRTKATGAVRLDIADGHGHFARLHLSNSGPVRKAA